jgi:S-adenosylmethionine:tRNA ribosyltransferase-isomerase
MTLLHPLNSSLNIADFDYILPPELIAQTPAPQRTASRLLDARQQPFADLHFSDITALLRPNDVLVFNDTQVIPARLFGEKATGGKIECLIERITTEHTVWVHIKASKMPAVGGVLWLYDGALMRNAHSERVTVLERDIHSGGLLHLQFNRPVLDVARLLGHLPLPPYITHAPDAADDERYQTVYAKHPGAAAAPTAGLHFDAPLLAQLAAQGVAQAFVTLHVGAGTFLPVRNDDIANHVMHSEWYTLPQATVDAIATARAAGGRVVCVGTTSLRALESAARLNNGTLKACSADTQLFIKPGDAFAVADALITNFHLPKSTLMMLVSALAGTQHIQAAYAHAIAQRYRFFSYGDAMFLERPLSNNANNAHG